MIFFIGIKQDKFYITYIENNLQNIVIQLHKKKQKKNILNFGNNGQKQMINFINKIINIMIMIVVDIFGMEEQIAME